MEDIMRAVVLGVVQGLTEFLPISSSGHLIAVRDLFGWEFTDELTFDVALHLGTTAAVIAFFWNEWLLMLRAVLARLGVGERAAIGAGTIYNERLLFLLALGSIPTAITGVIFDAYLEDDVRKPVIVGVMLIAGGFVLYAADWTARRQRDIADTNWRDAVYVGVAQAVSLVPGVSRSGVTISMALLRGFTRQDAARLSFLLATPAILGAGLLKTAEAIKDGIPEGDLDIIVVGAIVSAVTGWLAIRVLLRLVQFGTYRPYVAYRLIAGAFIIAYFAA